MYLNGLCFITDRKACSLTTEEMVSIVLDAGVRWIQHREKDKSRREIYEEATRLRKLTRKYNAVFIVNDYADIALAADADGVHLGQDDLPIKEARKILGEKIIGISTHSVEQAILAEREGADYIGFGPIFQTKTKDAGTPKNPAAISEIKKKVKIPVVAIGGITLNNLISIIDAGADAIAVASGILCGNVFDNAKNFIKILYKNH